MARRCQARVAGVALRAARRHCTAATARAGERFRAARWPRVSQGTGRRGNARRIRSMHCARCIAAGHRLPARAGQRRVAARRCLHALGLARPFRMRPRGLRAGRNGCSWRWLRSDDGASVSKPPRAWQPLFGGVFVSCRKAARAQWRHLTSFVRIAGLDRRRRPGIAGCAAANRVRDRSRDHCAVSPFRPARGL